MNTFSTINGNQVNLLELQNLVIGSVAPQIKKIDSDYKVLEVRYKIEGLNLTLLPIYTIKGQRSMQPITISLPSSSAAQSITSSVKTTPVSVTPTPVVSTPKTPTYTLSLTNSNLLPKIADISDPALIPFLTYTETISQSQIDTIVKYLISKVNITNNF